MTIKEDIRRAEARGFVKALLRVSGYLVNPDTKIEIKLTNIKYRTEDGEYPKIEIRILDSDTTLLHYGNINPVIIEDRKSIEESLVENMTLYPKTMWLETI